jgi:hypothetical protein
MFAIKKNHAVFQNISHNENLQSAYGREQLDI